MAQEKGSLTEVSDGPVKEFFGSITAHVEERIKSPFAGAFLVSWVVINWKSILIVLLSSAPIEDRIKNISASYLDVYSALWHPLWLSAALTIGFYSSSTIFSVISEFYGLVRSNIEKAFDKARWVRPSAYIELKRRFVMRTEFLEGLASDNLAIVDDEKRKTIEVSERLIAAQSELAQRTETLGTRTEEISALTKALLDAESKISRVSKMADDRSESAIANEILERLKPIVSEIDDRAHYRNGAPANELLEIQREIYDLQRFVRNSANRYSHEPQGQMSIQRLRDYLLRRFPGMPMSDSLLARVHKDMSSSGLLAVLDTDVALDKVFNAMGDAVSKFSKDKPEVFTSSVDYLSKSLGFAFPQFRTAHRFSANTADAFSKYANLIPQSWRR